jgi:hypothetical protein
VAVANCFDQDAISAYEFAAVVFQTRQEMSAPLLRYGLVLGGESLRKLLETLDAER